MKIQEIQFPLNIGTADELRVNINEGVVYFSLTDTTSTSQFPNGAELPYKILYSDRIILSEEEVNAHEDLNAYANDLVVNLLGVEVIQEQE